MNLDFIESPNLVLEVKRLFVLTLIVVILLFQEQARGYIKILLMRWRNPIRIRFARAKEIDDALVALRVSTAAARAYVCEFHNGGEFARAGKIWRITCTYEKPAPGVADMRDRMNQMMIERLREWADVVFAYAGETLPASVRVLAHGGRTAFWRTVDSFPPGYCRTFFEERGARIVALCPVYTFGMPTGMVCLDYTDCDVTTEQMKADMVRLAEAAKVVNHYLEQK